MRTEVTQAVQVFRDARGFLTEMEIKPEPELGSIAKHVEELDDIIDKITAGGVSQARYDRASQSMTGAVRAQAEVLRTVYLKPASRMRQRLFRNDPTVFRAVTMPKDRGYERLLASAHALADEAAAHRASFEAAGFAENFADQLKQAADQLRQSLDARRAHVGRRSGATLEMVQELAAGRELVRLLDAMVTPWLKAHAPGKLGEWKTLTRFERSAAPVEKPEGGEGAGPTAPEVHAA